MMPFNQDFSSRIFLQPPILNSLVNGLLLGRRQSFLISSTEMKDIFAVSGYSAKIQGVDGFASLSSQCLPSTPPFSDHVRKGVARSQAHPLQGGETLKANQNYGMRTIAP
jgi:hypothetical protein